MKEDVRELLKQAHEDCKMIQGFMRIGLPEFIPDHLGGLLRKLRDAYVLTKGRSRRRLER